MLSLERAERLFLHLTAGNSLMLIHTPEPGLRGEGLNRPMITVSVMLATIIQAPDGTIANVALPHIQGSLNATQDQATWVLTSFIVAVAVAIPVTGWLSDRFGQKTLLLASIFGFTIASVLCGLSGSLYEIVIASVLQGLCGAALIPLSQAILLEINPREAHGRAMAVWGMGVMLGPILGPALGGWLTDSYDWRWCFYINAPVGMAAFLGVWKYIPRTTTLRSIHFDWLGFATLSLAVGVLQLMLDRGQQNDWFAARETWVEVFVCVSSLGFFTIHTTTLPPGTTFLDYRLLTDRNFLTGLLFTFVVGLILFATRALTPSLLQGLMRYPAQLAGAVTAPSGIGALLAMLVVGRLVGRVETRLILGAGFLLTAGSLAWMTRYTLNLSVVDIVWPGVIQGIGLGLIFVPLSVLSFATLPRHFREDGAAVYNLVRNMGSAIGIAVVQSLLVCNTQIAHEGLVQNLNLRAAEAGLYTPENGAAMEKFNDEVTRLAALIGYIDNFQLMMVLTLFTLPLLLLVQPRRDVPGQAEEMDLVGLE